MKMLVTGAAGFIGSHTCDQLLAAGHEITGMDNLSVGAAENLSEARKSSGFSFRKADVLDKAAVTELGNDFDVVIHEAACKIPMSGETIETLMVNTEGTKNMLEFARKNDARFVFASTSDVYGKGTAMPFREDADIVLGSPEIRRWAYAASKVFDEHLVRANSEENGLEFVILRYFNSYGPRGYPGRKAGPPVVFITDALQKGKITIHGDGSQKRCFCYCTDTAHGTVLAATKKEARNETFNIGNDRTEITIKELALMTKAMLGNGVWPLRKSRLLTGQTPLGSIDIKLEYVEHAAFYKSARFDEIARRVPDLTKAGRLLGYGAEVGLEEGMRATVGWGREMICRMMQKGA